jgi:hypothetical protein
VNSQTNVPRSRNGKVIPHVITTSEDLTISSVSDSIPFTIELPAIPSSTGLPSVEEIAKLRIEHPELRETVKPKADTITEISDGVFVKRTRKGTLELYVPR